MQYTKDKLKAQQMVLFHLGFYKGVIDGIWSMTSINAKKAFEAHPSFLPANPNGGLPFGERDRLPKGMTYRQGLVRHEGLTDERIAEIEKGMQARTAASQAKEETKIEAEAEVEVAAVEEQSDDAPVEQAEQKAEQKAENKHHNQQHNQHNYKKRR